MSTRSLRTALPSKPGELLSSAAPESSLSQLGDPDPYARTAAIETLRHHPEILRGHDWKTNNDAVAKAHYAIALKRLDPVGEAGIIPKLLEDPDSDVRYVGIKWIADERLTQYRDQLSAQLDHNDLKRRDLLAVVAALAEVSGGSKEEFSPGSALLKIVLDESKPPFLRALALHGVPVDHAQLRITALSELARSDNARLQREAVRALAIHADPKRALVLAQVASDENNDSGVRADAIAGLALFVETHQVFLLQLAESSDETITREAWRTLASAGLIQRNLETKPAFTDISAWEKMLDDVPGQPNLKAGRRLFFHQRLATCSNCHAMNGRGLEVGPDLTTISRQAGGGRKWLLTHVLDPNAEVAPYFRPQMITTKDGQTRMGFIAGREGKAQSYIGSDGKIFSVFKTGVTAREEVPISLMPPGLLMPMTSQEIRDLIAYVLRGNE